jgi:hypothetical protein
MRLDAARVEGLVSQGKSARPGPRHVRFVRASL